MEMLTKTCLRLEKYARKLSISGCVRKRKISNSGKNKGPKWKFFLTLLDGTEIELGYNRMEAKKRIQTLKEH